ncbi:hypothetical protein LLH00_17370 [bacterium]|nr:hypothetical protein [bacterium]
MHAGPDFPLVSRMEPGAVRAGEQAIELSLEGHSLDGIVSVQFVGGGIRVLTLGREGPNRLKLEICVDRTAATGYRFLLLTDIRSGVIVARQQLLVEAWSRGVDVSERLEKLSPEARVPGKPARESATLANPYDWI